MGFVRVVLECRDLVVESIARIRAASKLAG
jgi:hypothetical protein